MTKAKQKKTKQHDAETRPAPEEEAERPPEAEARAAEPPAEEQREDAAPGESAEPEVDLEAEVAGLKDKLLRALAEAENVRRRAERDRIDVTKYAIANFARDLLAVADNLRRALDSVDGEAREGNEVLENLVVGVEMTEREMLNVLERNAIAPIEAMGRKFDHNLHEAMFELEDPDKPAGTVVQVLQTGYVLNGRLLRPTKVVVSKGGPREAPKAKEQAEDEAEPDPAAKGPTEAYEKQADTQAETTGSKLDEKL